MLLIDTLRADHLSCYGYELETSPHLDALAARGTLFEAHSTQCNSTNPSITSILSGVYPRTHSVFVPVPLEGYDAANEQLVTLAESLAPLGFHRASVWSHPSFGPAVFGRILGRGWDSISFVPEDQRGTPENAAETNSRVFAELDAWEAQETRPPLFLLAHYFDPHTPYTPSPPFLDAFLEHHCVQLSIPGLVETLRGRPFARTAGQHYSDLTEHQASLARIAVGRARYDEAIATMDREIGALLERLEGNGVLENAIVVLLADHGENLEALPGRRKLAFNHARLYESVLGTPLVIAGPGLPEGHRVRALSQNIDLFPTLLELYGLPAPAQLEGASLMPLIQRRAESTHAFVLAESSNHAGKAIKSDDLKLIQDQAGAEPEAYLWREDPAELREVAAELDRRTVQPLLETLEEFRPSSVLRVRAMPSDEPYHLKLRVRAVEGTFLDCEGPGELLEGGQLLRVKVRVDEEPVEVTATMDQADRPLRCSVRQGEVAFEPDRVFLGRTELPSTTAIPLMIAGVDAAPADARLRLQTLPSGRLSIDVGELHAEGVELELRPALVRYGQDLTPASLIGLERITPELDRLRKILFLESLPTDDPTARAVAEVPVPEDSAGLLLLARSGGRWIDLDRISISGRAIDDARLWFQFPKPYDERLMGLLLNPPEEPPPGSLSLWIEGGSAASEIDAGQLEDALLEQLRGLGYVR